MNQATAGQSNENKADMANQRIPATAEEPTRLEHDDKLVSLTTGKQLNPSGTCNKSESTLYLVFLSVGNYLGEHFHQPQIKN